MKATDRPRRVAWDDFIVLMRSFNNIRLRAILTKYFLNMGAPTDDGDAGVCMCAWDVILKKENDY